MPQDNISILLVDDEHLIQQSFAALLRATGYSVRTADNGVTALSSLRGHVPNLILSDLDMPEMSGFEFLSVVRRRFSGIKVVAMSGAFSKNEIPAGLCADAFFPKGVHHPKVLLQIIKDVLAGERTEMAWKQTIESPVWAAQILYGDDVEPSIILTCPDCLRSYPHSFFEANIMLPQQAECACCGNLINYSVIKTFFTSVTARHQPTLSLVAQPPGRPQIKLSKIPA
jgi:CheY-like chemotaxis protein